MLIIILWSCMRPIVTATLSMQTMSFDFEDICELEEEPTVDLPCLDSVMNISVTSLPCPSGSITGALYPNSSVSISGAPNPDPLVGISGVPTPGSNSTESLRTRRSPNRQSFAEPDVLDLNANKIL